MRHLVSHVCIVKNIDIVLPSQPEIIVVHYYSILISCGAFFVNQQHDSHTQREKEQEKVALQMGTLSKNM
jgi:hypothetical protein